jgi:hypothetical protein
VNGGGDAEALESSGQAADEEFSPAPPPGTVAFCETEETTWIEIQMIGEDDKPVPGLKYQVELPDGSIEEGTLDAEGMAGFEGLEPGRCKISFPDLDREAWEPLE